MYEMHLTIHTMYITCFLVDKRKSNQHMNEMTPLCFTNISLTMFLLEMHFRDERFYFKFKIGINEKRILAEMFKTLKQYIMQI